MKGNTLLTVLLTLKPIAGLMILCFLYIFKKYLGKRQINSEDIYTKSSVHSFIFAKGIVPKIIYFVSMLLQFALFFVYILATNTNDENTDWNRTFRCPDNRIDCVDLRKTNAYGWTLFGLVVICSLGRDLLMSLRQMEQGVRKRDSKLVTSGLVLLILSGVALLSSFIYNRALAEKNTDLIMNAVVLIFVMDIDDQIYMICEKSFPMWTKRVDKDIKEKIEGGTCIEEEIEKEIDVKEKM